MVTLPTQGEATAGVFLGTRRVGTLWFRDQFTRFEYEDFAPDHPVLGQGFEDNPVRVRTARVEVPEWFANLLPEPDSPLRRFMADRIGIKAQRSFPLLVHLGNDLPGALRVVLDGASDYASDGTLRFSLAGVQLKFSMRRHGRALTLPASGSGGNWIVKLPDRRYDNVPENEYTMLRWAATAGIAVPDIDLMSGSSLVGLPDGLIHDSEQALAVERFDRIDGDGRIHMEDLAQVREVFPREKYDGTSYSDIARGFAALCPSEDLDEYVRRLVSVVAMGNSDAHLKNWTLTYPDGRQARLPPAYDLVCITCYGDFRDAGLAFHLGRERNFGAIMRRHFQVLAAGAGLDERRVLDVVDGTVHALLESWPAIRRESPAPDFVLRHIDERLRTLPLFSGR